MNMLTLILISLVLLGLVLVALGKDRRTFDVAVALVLVLLLAGLA